MNTKGFRILPLAGMFVLFVGVAACGDEQGADDKKTLSPQEQTDENVTVFEALADKTFSCRFSNSNSTTDIKATTSYSTAAQSVTVNFDQAIYLYGIFTATRRAYVYNCSNQIQCIDSEVEGDGTKRTITGTLTADDDADAFTIEVTTGSQSLLSVPCKQI